LGMSGKLSLFIEKTAVDVHIALTERYYMGLMILKLGVLTIIAKICLTSGIIILIINPDLQTGHRHGIIEEKMKGIFSHVKKVKIEQK